MSTTVPISSDIRESESVPAFLYLTIWRCSNYGFNSDVGVILKQRLTLTWNPKRTFKNARRNESITNQIQCISNNLYRSNPSCFPNLSPSGSTRFQNSRQQIPKCSNVAKHLLEHFLWAIDLHWIWTLMCSFWNVFPKQIYNGLNDFQAARLFTAVVNSGLKRACEIRCLTFVGNVNDLTQLSHFRYI